MYVHTRIHAEIMDFLGLFDKISRVYMNTGLRPQGRCHITNPKNQKCSEHLLSHTPFMGRTVNVPYIYCIVQPTCI